MSDATAAALAEARARIAELEAEKQEAETVSHVGPPAPPLLFGLS